MGDKLDTVACNIGLPTDHRCLLSTFINSCKVSLKPSESDTPQVHGSTKSHYSALSFLLSGLSLQWVHDRVFQEQLLAMDENLNACMLSLSPNQRNLHVRYDPPWQTGYRDELQPTMHYTRFGPTFYCMQNARLAGCYGLLFVAHWSSSKSNKLAESAKLNVR
jgi:hypothetical protein